MSKIIEVNDEGELTLRREDLGSAKPHSKYEVEANPALVILRLVDEEKPFWSTASTEEWVESFHAWMNQPRPSAPVLPDEAMKRECIYD